ncbi:MAG: hypothetical protein WKF96_00185 [Solirubrobacteraceae bacterium]
MTPWERLLARLVNARKWPLPSEQKVRDQLEVWAALRENDEGALRRLMKWPADRPLMIDNLPEKIASAYGALLYGRDPRYTPTAEADAERMSQMVEPWAAGFPAAEETCASEGEVWWRLSRGHTLQHPSLTWHSRMDVVPLLHGRAVLAVAFIDQLESQSDPQTTWRHVELHGDGIVINLLFRGTAQQLGVAAPLTQHPETTSLLEQWDHGLPMLAGRVVNHWGRRPHVGVSIFSGVWTRMLALNEATTVGRENMRLTAKKRVVVPASAVQPRIGDPVVDAALQSGVGMSVQPRAQFDAGEDVLVEDPLDVDEGGTRASPYRVLEYSFDADKLIAWLRYETETICQRCDLVPQFIGSGDFGSAESGTALRVRLIPTDNATESRGRAWDTEQPVIAQRAALLEQLSVEQGGFGIPWSQPAGVPQVVRQDPFPVDVTERDRRHAELRTADLLSIETSLRERYPDAAEVWYAEERARILADIASTMPASTPFGVPAPTIDPPVISPLPIV